MTPSIQLKPEYLFRLLHALFRHNETLEEETGARGVMLWFDDNATNFYNVCEDAQSRLISMIVKYWNAHKHLPSVYIAHEKAMELHTPAAPLQVIGQYMNERLPHYTTIPQPLDMQALLDARVENWRTVAYDRIGRRMLHININQDKNEKGEPIMGPDDAMKYFFDEVQKSGLVDLSEYRPTGPQGERRENLPKMRERMLRDLERPSDARVYTGLPPMDEKVAIGPGTQIRFCGILGASGEFKTQILMHMIYCMARSGHHVLFVPRECSVDSAWRKLTWLHAQKFPDLDLGSLSEWENTPHRVTHDQRRAFDYVLSDLRSGTSILGSVDVIRETSFQGIKAHLKTRRETRYSVLAIDYIGHLDVEGRTSRTGTSAISAQPPARERPDRQLDRATHGAFQSTLPARGATPVGAEPLTS